MATGQENSPKPRVVMFHIGRSGSTVLADQMRQHLDIRWDGELFEVGRRIWDGAQEAMALLRRRMSADAENIYCFEFKFFHATLIGQTLESAVAQFVKAGFGHFIVLKRRNYLRKIVSSRVAAKSSRWFVRRDVQAPLTRVHIDTGCLTMDKRQGPLLGHLRDFDDQFERLAGIVDGHSRLWLSYEDRIKTDPATGFGKVCEFLNLPECQATILLGRTTPFKLRDVVENYDELCDVLRLTLYG